MLVSHITQAMAHGCRSLQSVYDTCESLRQGVTHDKFCWVFEDWELHRWFLSLPNTPALVLEQRRREKLKRKKCWNMESKMKIAWGFLEAVDKGETQLLSTGNRKGTPFLLAMPSEILDREQGGTHWSIVTAWLHLKLREILILKRKYESRGKAWAEGIWKSWCPGASWARDKGRSPAKAREVPNTPESSKEATTQRNVLSFLLFTCTPNRIIQRLSPQIKTQVVIYTKVGSCH